jgi:hypothetical protein
MVAPERIFFSTSIDQGTTWTAKADVSLAPLGVDHAFPSIASGAPGDTHLRAVRESRQRTGSMASSFFEVSRRSRQLGPAHDPIFSVKSVSNRIFIGSIEKNHLCVIQLHLQAQSVL